jgi:phage shock protein E
MFDFIKQFFGFSTKIDFNKLVLAGAIILDVRTKNEFSRGHIIGSVNIPVQELSNGLKNLKKGNAIITCCASGMRSASAKKILLSQGFNTVYNGGAWLGLKNKLKG